MPALNMFGVAWGWGSDDFCCPGFALAGLRAAWIAVLAAAWGALAALGDCGNGGASDAPVVNIVVPWEGSGSHCQVDLLLSYTGAMLLLQIVEALTEGAAAVISMRGSVMDPKHRRRCIRPLGYVHAGLSLLELLGAVLSFQLSNTSNVDTDDFDDQLARRCACSNETAAPPREQGRNHMAESWMEDATVAIEHAGQLVQVVAVTQCVLSCLTVCVMCCTHHKLKRSTGEGMGGRSANVNLSKKLHKKIKCCIGDLRFPQLPGSGPGGRTGIGEENPIAALASVLSSFFRGISRNDFVPTDVLAAIMLVGESQHIRRSRSCILHPAFEAAKEKQRKAAAGADESDSHLTLGVISKLGAKGAQARAAVQKAHAETSKSPLSDMVFAAFDGLRPEVEHADPLPLGVEERAQVISTAEHYMKYALGVYGWMLYAYRKGGVGFSCAPCAISELCTCCCCRQERFYGPQGNHGKRVGYKDDNCCHTNTSALLRTVWEFGRGGGQNGKGPAPDELPPSRSEYRVVYASWTVSVHAN